MQIVMQIIAIVGIVAGLLAAAGMLIMARMVHKQDKLAPDDIDRGDIAFESEALSAARDIHNISL